MHRRHLGDGPLEEWNIIVSSRIVPVVTLGVTHALSDATFDKPCKIWPDFKRGGMAEWSMAVVLKTCRIGYDVAVIFCRCVPAPHQISGHKSRALTSFRARPDNRSPEPSRISSKFDLFFLQASHCRDTDRDDALARLPLAEAIKSATERCKVPTGRETAGAVTVHCSHPIVGR